MKQSLWDLKLVSRPDYLHFVVNYEAIPMGFETIIGEYIPTDFTVIMKQSLWDLKLLPSTLLFALIPNYEAIPMGFETQE